MASPMSRNMNANKDSIVSVNLSGPVLACMIYDMLTSDGDQEGFLIGDVANQKTEEISDTEIKFHKEKNIVCIHHFVPCDGVFSFYDKRGQVDEGKVKNALGSHYKDLIGWYTFRRNTLLEAMFRERAVCTNLSKLLPLSSQPFQMFGIFTCSSKDKNSTLANDYVFLRQSRRIFEPVPVVVVNLGDTSQVQYKTSPLIFLHNNTNYYSEILQPKTLSTTDRQTHSSMDQVRNVQKQLQTKLEDVCRQLYDTEHQSDALQNDIRHLREQLKQANQDKPSDHGDSERTPKEEDELHLMSFDDSDMEQAPTCASPTRSNINNAITESSRQRAQADVYRSTESGITNRMSRSVAAITNQSLVSRGRKSDDVPLIPTTSLSRHLRSYDAERPAKMDNEVPTRIANTVTNHTRPQLGFPDL